MQGAAIVLRTLVPNARRIFSIVAEQQMQDPEQGRTGSIFAWCLSSTSSSIHLSQVALIRSELSEAVQDLSRAVSSEQ